MLDIYLMQYVSKSFKTNGEQKTCKQNNLPCAKFMNMICDLQCINHIFCPAHVSTPVYISVCTCLIFTLFTFPNLGHHSSPVPVPDVATWQDSINYTYLVFTYISSITLQCFGKHKTSYLFFCVNVLCFAKHHIISQESPQYIMTTPAQTLYLLNSVLTQSLSESR